MNVNNSFLYEARDFIEDSSEKYSHFLGKRVNFLSLDNKVLSSNMIVRTIDFFGKDAGYGSSICLDYAKKYGNNFIVLFDGDMRVIPAPLAILKD